MPVEIAGGTDQRPRVFAVRPHSKGSYGCLFVCLQSCILLAFTGVLWPGRRHQTATGLGGVSLAEGKAQR